MSSLVRLGLGLFLLWFAFALGFCFIFIDYKPQKTRVWVCATITPHYPANRMRIQVLLPFLISFILLWSFKYNIDPLMVLFNKRCVVVSSIAILTKHSETTPFRTIEIEEPYVKKLLLIRTAWVIAS